MKKRLSMILTLILAILVPLTVLADTLTVTFLDVGQGDAALLQCGSATMLVDAGTNAGASTLVQHLSGLGVVKLDYVVGTHPHEDHIGGLDAVIDAYQIGQVWMPRVQHDTQTFEDVLLAIQRKGLSITSPAIGSQYVLGDATITVLAPNSSIYSELNDYSIVLRVDHGSNSFLLTGDAESLSEGEMLAANARLNVDVLKVGHHGSDTSSTQAFLTAVSPKYAVISVGTGNTYGHPTASTLNRLQATGSQILRTDELGNITFVSDRSTLALQGATATAQLSSTAYAKTNTSNVNVRASASAKGNKVTEINKSGSVVTVLGQEKNSAGETWYNVDVNGKTGYIRSDLLVTISATEAATLLSAASSSSSSGGGSSASSTAKPSPTSKPSSSGGGSYIGNKNTKKFHKPSCRTLPAAKNQVSFGSRDAAINAGYSPCGNCKP